MPDPQADLSMHEPSLEKTSVKPSSSPILGYLLIVVGIFTTVVSLYLIFNFNSLSLLYLSLEDPPTSVVNIFNLVTALFTVLSLFSLILGIYIVYALKHAKTVSKEVKIASYVVVALIVAVFLFIPISIISTVYNLTSNF